MTTKTKKITYWAAIDERGKVGTGDKRAEALAALHERSPKFDAKTTACTVHKFVQEIEVPEKKVTKRAKASNGNIKPKAKKKAARKKVAKKAKKKKKAKRAKAAATPTPSPLPW